MTFRFSVFSFRVRALFGFALLGLLSGCAPNGYYQPTENSASQKSGVTVFGEIDTSVVHTR